MNSSQAVQILALVLYTFIVLGWSFFLLVTLSKAIGDATQPTVFYAIFLVLTTMPMILLAAILRPVNIFEDSWVGIGMYVVSLLIPLLMELLLKQIKTFGRAT